MIKKIFSQAKLVRAKRWYIEYNATDTQSGEVSRHRNSFDLHEIENEQVRLEVALRIISNLDSFVRIEPALDRNSPTVLDSLKKAYEEKLKLPRANSYSTYRTCFNALSAWLKKKKYHTLPVKDFTRKHVHEFWDDLTKTKFRGRTLNNYRVSFKALWNVLEDREIIEKNPWRLKPARVETKKRRNFTPEERKIVAGWAEQNDYWMFRGMLLQYYCYVRPCEISRLKFRDFNFSEGTVTVQEDSAKSWRQRVVTIPQIILKYFIDGRFEKYPGNFYLYGMPDERGRGGGLQPASKPANHMRMYKRHAELLQRLHKGGKIQDIEGLSWYSWKDTGITENIERTSPLATRDQAGHTDLKVTLAYYHKKHINSEYKKLDFDLF